MSRNGSDTVTAAETTASIIQHTHAKVTDQYPQYGQHRKIQLSTSVAKPMGIVPRNKELVGSAIITAQISGYKVYRTTDMPKAKVKRIVFRTKKATESQYSQSALKGMVMSRRETMPVPMVTENHDGEKLRTTRRQPTSYFDGVGSGVLMNVSEPPDGSDDDRTLVCERDRERRRFISREDMIWLAGIVIAGLLEAMRSISRSSSVSVSGILSRFSKQLMRFAECRDRSGEHVDFCV
jgi:hypothetical protein